MARTARELLPVSFATSEHKSLIADMVALQAKLLNLSYQTIASRTEDSSQSNVIETRRRIEIILKLRRSRDALFCHSLFGEPAWDMLLELYSVELAGRFECVSGLCLASGVPATTALRWIKALVNKGWITRIPDRRDGRRSLVCLTGKSKSALDEFFAQPELATVLGARSEISGATIP